MTYAAPARRKDWLDWFTIPAVIIGWLLAMLSGSLVWAGAWVILFLVAMGVTNLRRKQWQRRVSRTRSAQRAVSA